ncbi:iron chelate uptake ABC transporter family permease subunit [Peptoniphilus sp. MSJ-1]|uniref:Iron chelate uptake ABC transporter family permease subunit n=1 Tax=Peptoniphilus ovalis TaxID=2841503 RepID=A0ABS6FI40_9FIRM|nr:iron chelate uptake ABC transporter family permease subunit [Peptoniphilus ovalis]MBU5669824.1 iron chelate uptake ABC transporter family permease subunit [Peptoniphilus ovalis]
MTNKIFKKKEAQNIGPHSYQEKKLFTIPFIVAIIITISLAIISLLTGVYDISGEFGKEMFFITRIPRTASLMLTGSAMAISGVVMQLLTQNKFVEPTTTGTIEWAGLGIVCAYIFKSDASLMFRMGFAILFSFCGTMIFFLFMRKIKLKSSLIVPIIGIMIGAVVSSISTFVGLVFNMTQSLEVWFAGSFSSVQRGRYEYLFFIIIITIVIFLIADRLTIAGLGEDVATNLGLDYNRIILLGTSLVSLAVGVVAAVIGNLPFLGLIIPNLVSIFRGDDLRSNLPWVCLMGMIATTSADIISRTIIMPFEVPVSLILGTVGAAVFIGLILYKRRRV